MFAGSRTKTSVARHTLWSSRSSHSSAVLQLSQSILPTRLMTVFCLSAAGKNVASLPPAGRVEWGGEEEERRQQYRDYMPSSHFCAGLNHSSPQSNKYMSLLIFLRPALFFFPFALPASFVCCKKKMVFDIDGPILQASTSKRNCPFTLVKCHYFL